MRNDIDAIVDDLLSSWHQWKSGYQHTRGHAGASATCKNFNAPTHWDWQNGAADDHADLMRMRAVDQAVDKVPNDPQPWNTMLQFEARTLCVGFSVFRSPRLPADPEEFEVLRLEARNMLLVLLQRSGMIG